MSIDGADRLAALYDALAVGEPGGIELSEQDSRLLTWVAEWEAHTVEAFCDLFERVRAASSLDAAL